MLPFPTLPRVECPTPESLIIPTSPDAAAAQRLQLETLLRDSPACLASLSGPDYMVTVTNKPVSLREALRA